MATINGVKLGPVGLGLMGMTWRPVVTPQDQAFAALKESLKDGPTHWNGGEVYGTPQRNSLHIVNEYFAAHPEDADKVILCIKSGVNPENMMEAQQDREGIRKRIDHCLSVLDGKKKLDLFEVARQDAKTPVETTIAAIAEYVKEGKIGGISLSEVSAETIRRAAIVHPIAAVEVELSLWATDILENGIAATCKELGIPILAYSPLGRGFLTGQIKSAADVEKYNPFLVHFPRFQPDVFDQNLWLVDEVKKLAKKKGATPAQIALAWVRALSNTDRCGDIIAIPGATAASRVKENMASKDIEMSNDDMVDISKILKKFDIVVHRISPGQHTKTDFQFKFFKIRTN